MTNHGFEIIRYPAHVRAVDQERYETLTVTAGPTHDAILTCSSASHERTEFPVGMVIEALRSAGHLEPARPDMKEGDRVNLLASKDAGIGLGTVMGVSLSASMAWVRWDGLADHVPPAGYTFGELEKS